MKEQDQQQEATPWPQLLGVIGGERKGGDNDDKK